MAVNFVRSDSQAIALGTAVTTFQNVSQATIMCWCSLDSLPDLIEIYAYSIGPPPGVSNDSRNEIEILGDGHIQLDCRGDDSDPESNLDSDPGGVTGDRKIYHLAVTTDYVNNYGRIYINGVIVKEGALSPALSSPTSNTTSKTAYIGTSEDLSPNFMNGRVEDCRAYTRVLSPAEIQTIFECQGVDGIVTGLVDRFILDDGAQGVVIVGGVGVANAAQRQLGGTGHNDPTFTESIAVTHRRRLA